MAPGSPAFADGGNGAGGTAGAFVDDNGKPTAEVHAASTDAGASGTSSSCEWHVVVQDDKALSVYGDDGSRLYSDTGRWLVKMCDGQPVTVNGAVATPERAPGADPAQLAADARQSVAIPAPPINTSPSADRSLYTRVRTWLWVDGGWWQGYSATAEAGGVSATVSATPVRAVWTMGDGGRVVCDGPGVEWRQGMPDDQTDCSYVYKDSSAGEPDGTYTITVTVEFEVGWTSSTGAGGGLARITRSASRTVRVGEIEAIETQ